MTNEKALEILKSIEILSFRDKKRKYFMRDVWQAQKVAIKALEQQQDVHDTCKKCIEFSEFKQTSEDCVSRDDVDAYIAKLMSGYLYDEERTRLEEFSAYLWELPSVTPQQRIGHWEYVQYDNNPNIGNWHCSECRGICTEMHSIKDAYNYCPNCGADMRGENNGNMD